MARTKITPAAYTAPLYDVLHVTRPKGTLCGLPADKNRTLKLGAAACRECLRVMEQQINDRTGKGK